MAANNPQAIANDPHAYLSAYITLEPSRDALMQLSGTVATYIQEQQDPTVAALYLSAVARHMANALPPPGDSLGEQRKQVLEAIGVAATKCDPRNTISQSGILPVLARWMQTASPGILTHAHVEFLQCSILAGQYRYAHRIVHSEWPRPGSADVVTVPTLRYYYLRGLVYMGCEDWQWAVRAFWTCLSVPFDGISQIAICAWKKLMFCQCILSSAEETVVTSVPANMSNAMTRFLTTREGDTNEEHVSAYRNLVKAFQTSNQVQFTALQQTHANVWQADGNTGMVERLAIALLHRRVRHLASIYSVISMEQLAKELQVAVDTLPLLLSQVEGLKFTIEAEFLVLDLVEAKHGNISQEGLGQLMDLAERIRTLDLSIATSSRYQHLKDGSSSSSTRVAMAAAGPLGVAEL